MQFYPIIQNFITGVLSRKSWGATSSAAYQSAMEFCNNWVVGIQGSVRKRCGSTYVNVLDGTGSVLKTLPEKSGNDNTVIFLDNQIRMINDFGFVTDSPNLVVNGSFTDKLNGWIDDTASIPVPVNEEPAGNPLLMTTGTVKNTATQLGRTLTLAASNDIDGGVRWARARQAIDVVGGDEHKLIVTVTGRARLARKKSSVQINIRVGTSLYGDNLVNKNIRITNAVDGAFTAPDKLELTFTPDVLVTRVYLMFELVLLVDAPVVDPSTGKVLVGTDSAKLFVNDVQLYNQTTANIVDITSTYTKDELPELQVVSDSAKETMYIAHKNHAPAMFRRNPSTGAWELVDITFINPPTSWAANNYPSVVAIFQSRLWFANNPTGPSKIWASKTGEYENFTLGGGSPTAVDALAFDLAFPATIRWMLGAKEFLIGADNSEWLLISSGGVITPTDFQFEMQSAYGTSNTQPVRCGMGVVYASNTNKKIRYIQDGGSASYAWVSQDLLVQAENISGGYIVDMCYILEPDYQIYALLSTGVLARCTFSTDIGVLAWALYIDGDGGFIRSITASNSAGGQYLYMGIERPSHPNQTMIERNNPQSIFEVCLDSNVLASIKKDGGVAEYDFISQLWTVFGSGIDGTGNVIRIANDGSVYVGGSFETSGLTVCNNVAMWDSGTEEWVALDAGVDGEVFAMCAGGTDMYVGGKFSSASGVADTVNVAKWDGAAWSALGEGLDSFVNVLYYDEYESPVTGNLYAGGNFLQSGADDVIAIAEYDYGTSDWIPFGGNNITGEVRGITRVQNGNIIAAGDFSIDYPVSCDSGIIIDNNESSVQPMFTGSPVINSIRYGYNDGIDGYWIAGSFDLADASVDPDTKGIARYDMISKEWHNYTDDYTGLNASINFQAVNRTPGGAYYFSAWLGTDVFPTLVEFSGGSGWSTPMHDGDLSTKPANGSVLDIVSDADSNIYFCGDFSKVAGFGSMGRVCKYNTTTGMYSRIGGGENLNSGTGGGLDGIVRKLGFFPSGVSINSVDVSGQLVAVGDFSNSRAANSRVCLRVARFDPLEGKHGAWKPVGVGLKGKKTSAHCLAFDPNGVLFVGGNFTNVGGNKAISRIAYYDSRVDDKNWYPLGEGIDDGEVLSLSYADGKIYVGGTFTKIAGKSYRGFATWDIEKKLWYASNGAISASNTVDPYSVTTAICVDNIIYAAGAFDSFDGTIENIAEYDFGTSSWIPLGGGVVGGVVNDIEAIVTSRGGESGSILVAVGGNFDSAGLLPDTKNFALWDGESREWIPAGSTDGTVNAITAKGPLDSFILSGDFSTLNIWADYVVGANGPLAPIYANGICEIDMTFAGEEESPVFEYTDIETGNNESGIPDINSNVDGRLVAVGSFTTSGRYINGLEHLDGRTVTPIALIRKGVTNDLPDAATNFSTDSVFHEYYYRQCDPVLVENGRIDIEPWVEDLAFVGISYDAVLRTVPLEGGERAGTSQGGANRWNKVFVRLNESNLPIINGYQPPLNSVEELPEWGGDEAQAFVSGDYDVSSEGFKLHSAVEISAPSSMRTEVVGIFGKAGTNKL